MLFSVFKGTKEAIVIANDKDEKLTNSDKTSKESVGFLNYGFDLFQLDLSNYLM